MDFTNSFITFLLIYFLIGLPIVVLIEFLKKLISLFYFKSESDQNLALYDLIDPLTPIIGESDINKANLGLYFIILLNLLTKISQINQIINFIISAYIIYIILHGIFSGLNGMVLNGIYKNIIKYANISAFKIEKILLENSISN